MTFVSSKKNNKNVCYFVLDMGYACSGTPHSSRVRCQCPEWENRMCRHPAKLCRRRCGRSLYVHRKQSVEYATRVDIQTCAQFSSASGKTFVRTRIDPLRHIRIRVNVLSSTAQCSHREEQTDKETECESHLRLDRDEKSASSLQRPA